VLKNKRKRPTRGRNTMSCHSNQRYQQGLEKQKLNKDRRLEHHVLPFQSRSKDYGHCFDPCFTTYVLSIPQIQDDSTCGVFKEERNCSTTFDMLPLCSLKKSLHFLLPY